MGILNRFFLFVLTLFFVLLSLGVLAVCLQVVPEHYWLNELRFALGRTETVAVFAAVLFLSLHLLLVSCSRQAPKKVSHGELVMVESSMGEVGVALEAVRGLVEKLVREVRGVRDAKVKVCSAKKGEGEPLSVSLALIIGQETNVAEVSAAASQLISSRLEKILGYSQVPVEVLITDITNAAPDRKHRVV